MNTSPTTPRPRQLGTGARLALAEQTRRPAEMVTTTTPGSVSVEIDRPGAHVVSLESAVPTRMRGFEPALALTAGDLRVTVAEGVPVEVETYTRDLHYDAARGGSGVVGQALGAALAVRALIRAARQDRTATSIGGAR